MTGLQIFNEDGIEIVNSNDPMPFVFASGTVLEQSSGSNEWKQIVNYSGWPEAPTVWIRPKPGYFYNLKVQHVSATQFSFSVHNARSVVDRIPPFDWVATASAKAAKIVPPAGGYGIEVFDENGNLTFSSGQKFPRVVTIQQVKGAYSNSGGTIISPTATITYPFTSMPWIQLSDVKTSRPFPANVDGASYVLFGVSISADFRTITCTLSDSVVSQYNQFQNSNMFIPMAIIPGT